MGILVVGGGVVAERKVKSLLACGAKIRLVSPALSPGLRRLVRQGRIEFQRRRYRPADLRQARLVYASTDRAAINAAIAVEAQRAGKWVNVADAPERSNFLVPALIRRGGLTIAISSSGHSPALSRRVRLELGKFLGRGFSEYVRFLGRVRRTVLSRVPAERDRRMLFNRLISPGQFDLIRSGRVRHAKKRATALLAPRQIKRRVKR